MPVVPTERPLAFSFLFEGLDKALGTRLREPALLQKLAVLGINLDKLEPAYPQEVWEKAMETIAAELFPGMPLHEQLRHLGRDASLGMLNSMMGKAMLSLARVIGVKRSLMRMSRNFRNGNNYAAVEVVEHGPNEVEMVVSVEERFQAVWAGKSEMIPYYTLGVLEAAMEALQPRSHRVRIMERSSQLKATRYRISWEA